MKNLESSSYNPRRGFIGPHQVNVVNYIFKDQAYLKNIGHQHTKSFAKQLMKKQVKEHFSDSKNLTKFLKRKDLSFSKKTKNGYKKFTVPCTTSVVSIPKSMFSQVEEASKVLMFSLRKVLQSIYGHESIEQSEFVQSLPSDMKETFIDAIRKSPQYFKQLHHPNMKSYPFLDNVGLDLVLADQYLANSKKYIQLIKSKKFDHLPELPFKILELNAGSPSGASNNMSILEGIREVNPQILNSFGNVMPNDHFKVLGETYKSLGEDWTGNTNGIQIVLPPGGSNGAAPEIHQLAAYSGLVYADSVQLYSDYRGFIRLRTITGSDPIVNAIYSRINSDAALFNPKKGIFLRDPESGKKLYVHDPFLTNDSGKALPVCDAHGKPVPLESNYQIPNLLESILSKKIYMGGLNRILDNKIILTILTHYAPLFYSKELKAAGLSSDVTQIKPPTTLPPEMNSVKTIKSDPDNWVVKAPALAGGEGVYILKTLSCDKKKAVLKMAQKKPKEFAYQELVRIGRIPVAKINSKKEFHLANLAADIRMWVFYGGNNTLPKLTHNALVRYAPQEKGSLSSIVNTSKGGGYAPFIVVDDMNDKNSVPVNQMVKPQQIKPFQTELPSFVAAELLQVSRIAFKILGHLNLETQNVFTLGNLISGLKEQCREVISFLNPVVMEIIFEFEQIINTKIPITKRTEYLHDLRIAKLDLVEQLNSVKNITQAKKLLSKIDELHIFSHNKVDSLYKESFLKEDVKVLNNITKDYTENKNLCKVIRSLKSAIRKDLNIKPLSTVTKNRLKIIINKFLAVSKERLEKSNVDKQIISLFESEKSHSTLCFSTLFIGEDRGSLPPLISTHKELLSGTLLTDTDYISTELQEARAAWGKHQAAVEGKSDITINKYLATKRVSHFKKFPFLKDFQDMINGNQGDFERIYKILDIAPYAKYNIENFAKQKGILLTQVFRDKLTPERIAIVSKDYLKKRSVNAIELSGECYAKKRDRHGLLSDSDIFLWINSDLDPFSQVYTAGHELTHYQQIRSLIKSEVRSIQNSPIDFANFLNYYGNFLGLSSKATESSMRQEITSRQPFYGYEWLYKDFLNNDFVHNFVKELSKGNEKWNSRLQKYGSYLSYAVDQFPQSQTKALREVIPALENGKNIRFAKDLGLEVGYDEIKSVLPTANKLQLKIYKKDILNAIYSPKPDLEALRLIASHQLYGVRFARTEDVKDLLTIKPALLPISLGATYNQTQQQ